MTQKHPAPYFNGASFKCPHCDAFAQMTWAPLSAEVSTRDTHEYSQTWLYQAVCLSCRDFSLWQEAVEDSFDTFVGTGRGEMLHPTTRTAPPPHPDLPDPCRQDYEEARKIAQASPRGAAALLRLCIQKLCKELGQKGADINTDIAALVKQGLPVQIQQALDAVRVIGNEAVHPGKLTSEDHAEHADTLFELVNIIVQQQITQPAAIAAIYEILPAGRRAAIEARDSKSTPQS